MRLLLLVGIVYCSISSEWLESAEQEILTFWGLAPSPTPTPDIQQRIVFRDSERIRTNNPVKTTTVETTTVSIPQLFTTATIEPTLQFFSLPEQEPVNDSIEEPVQETMTSEDPVLQTVAPPDSIVPIIDSIQPSETNILPLQTVERPTERTRAVQPSPFAEGVNSVAPKVTAVDAPNENIPTLNENPIDSSSKSRTKPNYTLLVFVGVIGALILSASIFGYRSFQKKHVSFHPLTKLPDLEEFSNLGGNTPTYRSGYHQLVDHDDNSIHTHDGPLLISEPEKALKQKESLLSLIRPLGAQFRLSVIEARIQDFQSVHPLLSKGSVDTIQSISTKSK
jgi:hypothetical protein